MSSRGSLLPLAESQTRQQYIEPMMILTGYSNRILTISLLTKNETSRDGSNPTLSQQDNGGIMPKKSKSKPKPKPKPKPRPGY